MAMEDGFHTLDRCSFQTKNQDGSEKSRFDFTINPQSIQEQTENRTVYLNSKEWGITQNYGMGQKTITLSGTTGWRHGLGIDEAWQLKAFLQDYQNVYPLDDSNNRVTLVFNNYTDDYSYNVELSPSGYQFNQDVSQPLLVRYTITLIVIGDPGKANSQDRTDTLVGRPGEGGVTNGNVGPSTQKGAVGQAIANLRGDAK